MLFIFLVFLYFRSFPDISCSLFDEWTWSTCPAIPCAMHLRYCTSTYWSSVSKACNIWVTNANFLCFNWCAGLIILLGYFRGELKDLWNYGRKRPLSSQTEEAWSLSHESLTVFWFLNFHGIDWTAISTTTHAWYNLSVCNEKWCWRLLKLLKSEWFKNSSVDMYSIINSDMALAFAAFGFYKVSLFCMTWLYSDRILVSFLQML